MLIQKRILYIDFRLATRFIISLRTVHPVSVTLTVCVSVICFKAICFVILNYTAYTLSILLEVVAIVLIQ